MDNGFELNLNLMFPPFHLAEGHKSGHISERVN